MRVWIIKTGEPVPYLPHESDRRMFRSGALVQALLKAGHDVTWWTGHFSHQDKTFREVAPNSVVRHNLTKPEPDMVYLGSSGYKKNIGMRRLVDHACVARNFSKIATVVPKPDLIVVAWPTIDLANAAIRYGNRTGVPVVTDVRDLWPDVIYERLPSWCRGCLIHYEIMGKRVFRNSKGVTGVSQAAISWVRDRFGTLADAEDKPVFQSKYPCSLSESSLRSARQELKAKGIDTSCNKTRFVWSGNLVPDTDANTLMQALKLLPRNVSKRLEFIFCGKGSLVPEIVDLTNSLSHLKYAGWLDQSQLATLTRDSHIGLLCYLDRFDFRNSVPNKVVDYCAASMRTLTNLGGEVPRLLGPSDSLITYRTGDVPDLIRVLTNISENPDRYRVNHAPARAVFDQHFHAEKVMNDYVTWLERLVA